LALKLNGRQYGEEITEEEENAARAAGLVVVFGASDDLCELRGAIHDERGAYGDSAEVLIVDGGIFAFEECESHCLYAQAAERDARKRGLLIHPRFGRGWTFATEIPHATFDVWENDSKYGQGIVFELPR
jgi:hypothetical protein